MEAFVVGATEGGVGGVLEGTEEDELGDSVAMGGAFEIADDALGDGAELGGSSIADALFAESSFTSFRICEVSGVAGGICAALVTLDPFVVFNVFFAEEVDFELVFEVATAASSAVTFVVAVLDFVADLVVDFDDATFVDFALVAVNFGATSEISSTRGSVTTFLGLPLFLTTSVDIFYGIWFCNWNVKTGRRGRKGELSKIFPTFSVSVASARVGRD